jgi:hypothetical protein
MTAPLRNGAMGSTALRYPGFQMVSMGTSSAGPDRTDHSLEGRVRPSDPGTV